MSRRALEIGAAVESWWKLGGRVAFMTFTVRHSREDSLTTVWDAIAKSWGRVTAGKGWKLDRDAHGVAGFVKVVEVTHGRNGWHVHVHALVFLRAGIGDARQLHRSMFRRWRAGAESAGLRAPLARAQDLQVLGGNRAGRAGLSGYLTKAQYSTVLGQELTNSQSKQARKANSTRSTWELLRGATDGLDSDVRTWAVFESGSKGRRQIAWSRGLRELLALGVEADDEEIAAEELGDESDTLAYITESGWTRMLELQQLAECLEAATVGRAALVQWLVGHRVEHELVRN